MAIALALEGAPRAEAAKTGAMDRQTLRDWVIRFNEAGPQGLLDRPKGHARCRLEEGQLAVLKAWMLRGPDPERDGVSAWRIVDAIAFCKERFGVPYSEEGMRRILRQELNLSHQKTRPVHPQHDPRRAEAFKKELPFQLARARKVHAGAEVQLWFMDEARIGQTGRAGHRWYEKR